MISVIVPVYNTRKEYLDKCVGSILNQTYSDIQLLLVDDGSKSDCALNLDAYPEKDARCKVFHIPHGGVSNARNYGVACAKGEYVSFVDSDDWISENFLETLLQKMNGMELAIMKATNYYENTKQVADKQMTHKTTICAERRHIFDVLYGCTDDAQKWLLNTVWAKLYLTDVIKSGNIKFDTSLRRLEDGVFNLRYFTYLKGNAKLTYIDTVGYYLRQHNDSTVHKYNPNLADDMVLPLEKMYEISVQSGMYEKDKKALGYRALLNSIVYINDGACGNMNGLRKSIKNTKTFINRNIIKKLVGECDTSHLQNTEKMVAESIKQGNAVKPACYFWLRTKIKR